MSEELLAKFLDKHISEKLEWIDAAMGNVRVHWNKINFEVNIKANVNVKCEGGFFYVTEG